MALRPRPVEQHDEAEIGPIDRHPQYAKLATMRRAILDGLTRRRQMIELHTLEATITRPATSSTGPRVQQMRDRAALLRRLLNEETPKELDEAGLPLPLARALELAAGGEVTEPETDTKRLARLQTEERLLERGLAAIDGEMDALRETLSFDVAQTLAPVHRAVLMTVWQAAAQLSAALDRESEVFALPLIAGYVARPDILKRPGLRAGALLGSQRVWDSEISNLRRRLEADGVIP